MPYQAVQGELETFLARAHARERPVPRFVERELRAFLGCGILAYGFVRVHCDECGFDRVVAFSCKGRGFCPSCGGRRMTERAAHLVDQVWPEVPVRQWVLTLPPSVRYALAWRHDLCTAVAGMLFRAIQRPLRTWAQTRRLGEAAGGAGGHLPCGRGRIFGESRRQGPIRPVPLTPGTRSSRLSSRNYWHQPRELARGANERKQPQTDRRVSPPPSQAHFGLIRAGRQVFQRPAVDAIRQHINNWPAKRCRGALGVPAKLGPLRPRQMVQVIRRLSPGLRHSCGPASAGGSAARQVQWFSPSFSARAPALRRVPTVEHIHLAPLP